MASRAERVVALLRRSETTLAVAESFTGGLLMDALTRVPGASDVFVGGVVAYSDRVKVKVLGVRTPLLRRNGAVSHEVAQAMARGVRRAVWADWGLSTTGIAGPGGGTPSKPVGLSYVAAIGPSRAGASRRRHRGTRQAIKRKSVEQALDVLLGLLRPRRRGA